MAQQPLTVELDLKWLEHEDYEAIVTVVTPDASYVAGELRIGAPAGIDVIPEVILVTFEFTHTVENSDSPGKTNRKSIQVRDSQGKTGVLAYAAVNGKTAGNSGRKTFPRIGLSGGGGEIPTPFRK